MASFSDTSEELAGMLPGVFTTGVAIFVLGNLFPLEPLPPFSARGTFLSEPETCEGCEVLEASFIRGIKSRSISTAMGSSHSASCCELSPPLSSTLHSDLWFRDRSSFNSAEDEAGSEYLLLLDICSDHILTAATLNLHQHYSEMASLPSLAEYSPLGFPDYQTMTG
nr:hypothetical protein Iba_chr12dCG14310 [Ipomoea batatas]